MQATRILWSHTRIFILWFVTKTPLIWLIEPPLYWYCIRKLKKDDCVTRWEKWWRTRLVFKSRPPECLVRCSAHWAICHWYLNWYDSYTCLTTSELHILPLKKNITPRHLEACSAEQVLASARQNVCYRYKEFWQALARTRSAEHTSDVLQS